MVESQKIKTKEHDLIYMMFKNEPIETFEKLIGEELRCDILLRNAICCLTATRKEFISYRKVAKRSYIAFEQSENISHECERVYRLKGLHLNLICRNMDMLNTVERSCRYEEINYFS